MNRLRLAPLVFGWSVCIFQCAAQELPIEPTAPLATPGKKSALPLNPPAILSHTDSGRLSFLAGRWLYQDQKKSIEETWLKSSLDEVTCIRITRKPCAAETPPLRLTIPTNRDPSLPEISAAESPSQSVERMEQGMEICCIRDVERGASVSLLKLDNARWDVQDHWCGCLDQMDTGAVSIELINLSNPDSKLVFTYQQLSPDVMVCTRAEDGDTQEFKFVKIK